MHVISVLNHKGGAGKTTIATNLSRAYQYFGMSVLLVDSDPQGSARDWAAVNEEQPVPVVGLDRPTLQRDLKKITNKEMVIIDGAPQSRELALSAILTSDLVLIPVQPSPYDVWASEDLVQLVKQRQEITDGKLKAAFVISRHIKGTKLGADVKSALTHYGIPIFSTMITQRVIYPSTASEGKTVLDKGLKTDASQEILALMRECNNILNI